MVKGVCCMASWCSLVSCREERTWRANTEIMKGNIEDITGLRFCNGPSGASGRSDNGREKWNGMWHWWLRLNRWKEKEIQTLFKLYGMCLFLWRPKQDVHQAGVKRKSQRDGIRGWHGFPGPKFLIYRITYRGPLTYIRLGNGVLPLDSVCLQGEKSP